MTFNQQLKIKRPITDANNRLNGILSSFDFLNNEFSSGSRLINIFPSCFSFYLFNRISKDNRVTHIYKLEECILHAFTNLNTVVVISDVGIKNQIAISIAHVHLFSKLIIKTLYYVVNVTITEAELFAIRCGINQVIQITDIKYIIVITVSGAIYIRSESL